ncbi:Transcription initiation factor IIE subunit alpha [Hirschfeldia incana]|nr:Transcription initiation factor IIE subunit alpha [Hirschfeldia incana]
MVVLSTVALVKTAYSWNSFVFEAEDIVFGSPWWFVVVGVACLLVLFAGIMSGLTLGLMSLGLVELEILQQSGSSAEKKQATAILPVVKKQHQLLVTLLLCNAAAMELFCSQLLLFLLLERSSRKLYARDMDLLFGANFLWLVRILMIICYPIAYPIGKVLDAVIGHNNTLFRRAQLKALVSIHSQEAGKGGELTHEETMIISGALDLSEKTAQEAMTPIESTFSLDVTTKLDWETIGKILSKGHSRIPVYLGNPKNIIGLLLVKSLLTVRAEAETPISSVSIRKIPRVPSDMPLYDILNEFQKGSSHMAAVVKDKKKNMQLLSHEETPKENTNLLYSCPQLTAPLIQHVGERHDVVVVVDIDKAPTLVENRGRNFKQNGIVTSDLPRLLEDNEDEEVIGIITLEDVFEELLQAEIVDETDVYIDVHKRVRVAAAAAAVSSIARASPVEYHRSKGGVTVRKLVGKEGRDALLSVFGSMDNKGPVQKTVVLEPFIKLVRLLARAFYDDYTTKSDNQQKTARSDNRGIAVVVLDELTRKQWVREEDLAKELKLHAKQLRKIIRHFEEQNLIMRDHRKETAKGAKMYSVAVAATTGGRAEDKVKFHTHSYCCLNYPQIYDIVRYKLHRMKKKLKDELEDKNTVQEYGCPNCQRKYNALDALRLISMEDDAFHCENCNGELVVECNKLTSEEVADGDDNARRRRREKLRDMLQKMEVQIKPLMDQINRVKDLPVPDFGSLIAWEARAAIAARENGELNPNDPLRSQGGYGSTPMPFLGETKVEVNLGEGKEDVKANGGDSSLKVLPPWMIKQGMNLTEEQRGEMRQEEKVDVGSSKLSDDKKSAVENGDDKDMLKDEYFKAYYAALIQQQQELAQKQKQEEESGSEVVAPDSELASTSSDRQVGMKSKREEEEDEWEEEPPVAVAGNGNYKVDLNVEAAETSGGEEEEEEDIDWEEG